MFLIKRKMHEKIVKAKENRNTEINYIRFKRGNRTWTFRKLQKPQKIISNKEFIKKARLWKFWKFQKQTKNYNVQKRTRSKSKTNLVQIKIHIKIFLD